MDINKTSITRRLEASLDGLQEEFRALYTAEDLSRAADELRRSAGRSDHSSKLKRLFGMLELCGVSYERSQMASTSTSFPCMYLSTSTGLSVSISTALLR